MSGVSSVAFIGHDLYGLLAGAGCSHGVPSVPNGRDPRQANDSSVVANLSRSRQRTRSQPAGDDFEPDGTWYSMISLNGALYPMDSNHGELDRVTPHGTSPGWPTPPRPGISFPRRWSIGGGGPGRIGNLGVFGPPDGTVKKSTCTG